LILALVAALSAAPPQAPGDVPGDQTVTVLVRGMAGADVLEAERVGVETLPLVDPGIGVRTCAFHGPPARFLQLRLVRGTGAARRSIYDGMVVLSDQEHETVAFQYQDKEAVRIPIAPSARIELALDQRVTWWVSFGWGALALGYVGLMGILWTRGRR
jgi:hypothetical protein